MFIKENLPHYDEVEVFGLHQNAAITSAINDTTVLLDTCLQLLPRTSGSAS